MKGSRWAAAITAIVALFTFANPASAADVQCYSHEADEVADHGKVVNGNSVVLNPYQKSWIYGEEGYYSLLTITSVAGQTAFIEDPAAGQAYFAPDNGVVQFWEVCKARRGAVTTVPPTVPETTAVPTTTVADTTTSTASVTTGQETTTTVATTPAPSDQPTTTGAIVLDQDVTASTLPHTGVAANVALAAAFVALGAGLGMLRLARRPT